VRRNESLPEDDARKEKITAGSTCYRVSGYARGRKFEETSHAPTVRRAISNVKHRIRKHTPSIYYLDIKVTNVEAYNRGLFRFEPIPLPLH
jgi:hypothetical protein